jgi:acetyltransferase
MIRRPRAHELILGMVVDPTFGSLMLFGTGGTAVEVVRDTANASRRSASTSRAT